MVTVGGFFSGTGGIEYAFRSAGAEVVYGCERDKFARQTYERNLGHVPYGDITELDPYTLPYVDVILGGFPCPAFSKAGQAKNRSLGRGVGFDHPVSGQMFFYLLNILQAQQPRAFLFENVDNLLNHDHGETWSVMRNHLEMAGYFLDTRVYDASLLVPQRRKRVYIVGFRKLSAQARFSWPVIADERPRLRDILERVEWPEYQLSSGTWAALQRHRASHEAAGNGFGYSLADLDGVTRTLSARYHKDGAEILIPQETGHPRRLSPREAFRLQGYPDTFKIDHLSRTQAWKQAGNAVAIPVVQRIASAVLEAVSASTSVERAS